jgi:glycosyltransferase involved in cell wall biosynthesis
MNTLVVAPFQPYPLVFGGAIRLYHLIRMLSTFSEVTVLCYRSFDGDDPTEHLQSFCRRVVINDTRPVDSRVRRAHSLVSRSSYQALAYRSAELQRDLDRLTDRVDPDAVIVETTPMGLFRLPTGPITVLDMQNIEHELVARRAAVSGRVLRRAALGREARKVRREELGVCRAVDVVMTPSDRETEIVKTWGVRRAETMANTIDATFFERPVGPATDGRRLAFVGTTHVDANRDGLHFFMREVFPLVRRQEPSVTLDIVGGSPPADIRAYGQVDGVTVTGFVPDVRDYMARATALVVPLRSGGGTRLKILEGLSYGVPTVSTSIGAEGLDLVDGQHLLLADGAGSFAAATVSLLRDGALRERLSREGRAFVEQHYDWRAQAPRLQSILISAITRHQRFGQPSQLGDSDTEPPLMRR